MDKNKAHEFIENNKDDMQPMDARFTSQQISLFLMLAEDLGVDMADVPMLLIRSSLSRISDLEQAQSITTLN